MMSWLFGTKKKEEQKLPEPRVTGVIDDFNVVQVQQPGTQYNSPIYPRLPQETLPYSVQARPSPSEDVLARNSVKMLNQSPLESIPFKLSPSLQNGHSASAIDSDIITIRRSLNQINENLNSNYFSYDFNIEKSVIHEEKICNGAQG